MYETSCNLVVLSRDCENLMCYENEVKKISSLENNDICEYVFFFFNKLLSFFLFLFFFFFEEARYDSD